MVLENFYAKEEDKKEYQIEGEMWRKASETKLKKYWYTLLGKELYVYRNKDDDKHKGFNSLIGVFIKEEPEEQFDGMNLFPFKLLFPLNKSRTYYCKSD